MFREVWFTQKKNIYVYIYGQMYYVYLSSYEKGAIFALTSSFIELDQHIESKRYTLFS